MNIRRLWIILHHVGVYSHCVVHFGRKSSSSAQLLCVLSIRLMVSTNSISNKCYSYIVKVQFQINSLCWAQRGNRCSGMHLNSILCLRCFLLNFVTQTCSVVIFSIVSRIFNNCYTMLIHTFDWFTFYTRYIKYSILFSEERILLINVRGPFSLTIHIITHV